MLQPETSLKFVVRRRAPELIAPAAPTPRELNPLSDLDHQPELRCQLHGLQFYRSHPKMANKNPATVIRDALAKVLVYYYPFAGRLREAPTQKLMVDCTGEGVIQFLTAFGEMAQGASSPSVLPVWQRELLFASEPPRATFAHHEHDVEEKTKAINDIGTKDLIQKSFFFGPNEVSTLRRRFVPEHLQRCSTFEVIAACVWRCRTIALQFDPNEEMRFLFPFNARDKLNPRLPVGYYGNAFILPSVVSTAGDLSIKPLSHVLELVTKAKALVSEGYVRSTIDLMAIKGRPLLTVPRSYILSNVARLGFSEIDFGWGKAAYGGPATGGIDAIPGLFNFYMHWTNQKGESGVLNFTFHNLTS
ncbi:Chloramphenicol acetyltransferase-like domain-containing protein [Cynara cardunculus var. scolymus]|uniref:Chloramphenicol acetyltransferase-like domain-containing protein n=1 Tax=Cynara cardunculus var. scolymus TaxID=59895 RepID=A0A103Y005_CYNCS|nr:Chloramphenicol acetyltransferase-like domain-containing protein [Cynara cardunculus var. scolymus]